MPSAVFTMTWSAAASRHSADHLVQRVLAHVESSFVVLEIAPHPKQVNGMHNHRVVDQHDTETFAVSELQRFRVGKLDTIE